MAASQTKKVLLGCLGIFVIGTVALLLLGLLIGQPEKEKQAEKPAEKQVATPVRADLNYRLTNDISVLQRACVATLDGWTKIGITKGLKVDSVQTKGDTVYDGQYGSNYALRMRITPDSNSYDLHISSTLQKLSNAETEHHVWAQNIVDWIEAYRIAKMPKPKPIRTHATSTHDANPGQCQATTRRGSRCSRAATAGSKYCWQHEG
jgi:hypothetical protein